MKKNNKFRNGNHNNNNNNNNHNQYSLTYKFDSASIAGKTSGTALDLIRKYNDLAKEAKLNHDYVSSEVFKQYAEHYRKIVTEINERKANNNAQKQQPKKEVDAKIVEEPQEIAQPKKLEEPIVVKETIVAAPKKKTLRKKIVVAKPKEESAEA